MGEKFHSDNGWQIKELITVATHKKSDLFVAGRVVNQDIGVEGEHAKLGKLALPLFADFFLPLHGIADALTFPDAADGFPDGQIPLDGINPRFHPAFIDCSSFSHD